MVKAFEVFNLLFILSQKNPQHLKSQINPQLFSVTCQVYILKLLITWANVQLCRLKELCEIKYG